jgi:transcription antitermination protein NusB
MASRRKAREHALQVLYLIDLAGTPTEQALELFRTNFESDGEDFNFVESLVRGVSAERPGFDQLLEESSEHWKVSRMPRIDRNILRLATYELLKCPETPAAVVLDEAVELAKRFGEAKSPSFVNGILDRIFRGMEKRV